MAEVQRSKEYYEWLYEGGPRPADLTEEQADIDRHRVLGKPKQASQSYHPNSIMGRMTPAERAKLRARIRGDSDVEYEEQDEGYEHALMRELDEKGL
jgi:hypothetical protein